MLLRAPGVWRPRSDVKRHAVQPAQRCSQRPRCPPGCPKSGQGQGRRLGEQQCPSHARTGASWCMALSAATLSANSRTNPAVPTRRPRTTPNPLLARPCAPATPRLEFPVDVLPTTTRRDTYGSGDSLAVAGLQRFAKPWWERRVSGVCHRECATATVVA